MTTKLSPAEHDLLKVALEEKIKSLETQQVTIVKEIRQTKSAFKKLSGMVSGGRRALRSADVSLEKIMQIIAGAPAYKMGAGEIITRFKEIYNSELAYSSLRAKLTDGRKKGYITKVGDHKYTRWQLTPEAVTVLNDLHMVVNQMKTDRDRISEALGEGVATKNEEDDLPF